MPNHCYQRVRITGNKQIVSTLCFHLRDEGRFCDAVIPTPLELWGAPQVSSDYGNHIFDHGRAAWYQWRLDNWDTKWDVISFVRNEGNVFDIETSWGIGEKSDFDLQFSAEKEAWFSFACWTAWGPPYAIWNRLMKMGVLVEASYFDEGGGSLGRWEDGVVTEWMPDADIPETRAITEFVYGDENYFQFGEQYS